MERWRMLIVDDDEDHRALMQSTLRRSSEPFEVCEASTCDEGKALLSSGSFDCALIDLKLPDGDGRDLIASAGATPVVIVTSADDRKLGSEAIAMGAQDYLVKEDITGDWLRRTLQWAMERKRGELERARAEHEHRLAALGRLAGSVGHEINNPASVVLLGLDSVVSRLRRLPETTRQRSEMLETLADCRDAIDRIVAVVRHLVVVASPSVTTAANGGFDLGAVVDSVCALAQRGEGVELRRSGARLGTARGRASEVTQALLAVLDNAVRASPAGGVVTVGCDVVGDRAVIRVTDQGPGIDDDHVSRIFEPFFTTREVGEGMGLGLSVARSAVREYGGTIEVAQTGAQGTTMCLSLPL